MALSKGFKCLQETVLSYCSGRSGATAIEYCLIAGGIALALFVALFALGDDLQILFETLSAWAETAIARITNSAST